MNRRPRTDWAALRDERRQAQSAITPGSLVVSGVRRDYWIVPEGTPDAPLILVLHGGGTTGENMASFSGLALRGPAAGFTTVFPEGIDKVWNDGRDVQHRRGADDAGFLAALVDEVVSQGLARREAVFVVGISNGAFMAEYVARTGAVSASGIVLVAGTCSERIRSEYPRPVRPCSVLMFNGTADPMVPYGGGPISVFARPGMRRGLASTSQVPRGVAVAAETVADDWVRANGLADRPEITDIPVAVGDVPATHRSWTGPGPTVDLYTVRGGGHGWPGGIQYLPARFIGPVARDLDATGILLEWAHARA